MAKTPPLPKVKQDTGFKLDSKGVDYLDSYYNSDQFKKRYLGLNNSSEYAKQLTAIRDAKVAYKPFVINKEIKGDPIGSRATIPELNKIYSDKYNKIPAEANILLSVPQAKRLKSDINSSILPHEYSHTARKMTFRDDIETLDKNKNKQALKTYSSFIKQSNNPDGNKDFSGYLIKKVGEQHNLAPNENHADLDALRYQMFKTGIYDTKKGNMTEEDFNKAKANPDINKNLNFKRLRENFKDKDIIWMNNNIAANKQEDDTLFKAELGGNMKKKPMFSSTVKKMGFGGKAGDWANDNSDTISDVAMLGSTAVNALSYKDKWGVTSNGAAIGSGALSGAAAGAKIGSSIPVVGTLAGGVIGAGVGAVSGLLGNKAANKRKAQAIQQSTAMELSSDEQAAQARIAGNPSLKYGNMAASYYRFGGVMKGTPASLPRKTQPMAAVQAKPRLMPNITESPMRQMSRRANGGEINPLSSSDVKIEGPSHENGGVKLPSLGVELEGGETVNNGFVFSKKLGFAKPAEKIAKQLGKAEARPKNSINDATVAALQRKTELLKVHQESAKEAAGIPSSMPTMADGGPIQTNPTKLKQIDIKGLRKLVGNGVGTAVPTKITNNPKDPKLKAYNDSLLLYNEYKTNKDRLLNSGKFKPKTEMAGWGKGPGPKQDYSFTTNDPLAIDYHYLSNDVKSLKYKDPKHQQTFHVKKGIAEEDTEYFTRKESKTSAINGTTDDWYGTTLDVYKKPKQPIVYKPKVPVSKPSTPITVTDSNDPRLTGYKDSLALYQKGQRINSTLTKMHDRKELGFPDTDKNVAEATNSVTDDSNKNHYKGSIKPTKMLSYKTEQDQPSGIFYPSYKKPTQPVVLESRTAPLPSATYADKNSTISFPDNAINLYPKGQVKQSQMDSLNKANPKLGKFIGKPYKGAGNMPTFGAEASDAIKKSVKGVKMADGGPINDSLKRKPLLDPPGKALPILRANADKWGNPTLISRDTITGDEKYSLTEPVPMMRPSAKAMGLSNNYFPGNLQPQGKAVSTIRRTAYASGGPLETDPWDLPKYVQNPGATVKGANINPWDRKLPWQYANMGTSSVAPVLPSVDTPITAVDTTPAGVKKKSAVAGALEAVSPFISNISNALTKLPLPPVPKLNDEITPNLVDYSASRQEAVRANRAADKSARMNLNSGAAVSATAAANLSQRVRSVGQINEAENNANTAIRNQTAAQNAGVKAGNNAMMNNYQNELTARTLKSQELKSANLANLEEKIQGMARDKKLFNLEGEKTILGFLSNNDTGAGYDAARPILSKHLTDDQLKQMDTWATKMKADRSEERTDNMAANKLQLDYLRSKGITAGSILNGASTVTQGKLKRTGTETSTTKKGDTVTKRSKSIFE